MGECPDGLGRCSANPETTHASPDNYTQQNFESTQVEGKKKKDNQYPFTNPVLQKALEGKLPSKEENHTPPRKEQGISNARTANLISQENLTKQTDAYTLVT